MSWRGFSICVSFGFIVACSAKPSEKVKKEELRREHASDTPAAGERKESVALRLTRPAPEAPVPAVDPSRIAVEEDFVADAAQRITKRSNLELELQRLAKEIASAPR